MIHVSIMITNFKKTLLFPLFVILTSFSSTFATTYYVDVNAGNDLNNGLSAATPWQTLTKVNSFVFAPNDSILFIRNGVWRGQLIPQSGSALGSITYSDYGTGAKPLLLGSVNKSSTNDWINEGGNIWRCSLTFSTDIGNLIFNNNSLFGIKKWTQLSLLTQGDYWYDLNTGKLKIFSTSNPASIYFSIECAVRNHIIYYQNVSYATFNNFALKYGAAHGFGGGNTSHLTIRACEISYTGGGDLNMDGSNIRFGNGIEFWSNAHDNTVEQCKIWEIYDTGLSNQNQGSAAQQYNIFYRNNIIFNCALSSFEYWNKPGTSTTANIRFENNTCVNAGDGWGTQRPDRVGVHVLLSNNQAITDSIFIRNNIFYNANTCLAMPATWNTSDGYQKLTLRNNCYYQPLATDTLVFLFYSTAYSASSFTSYQTATGQDASSIIINPLFSNYSNNNFHITSTSPVINLGYPISLLKDFDNENRSTAIDIGADEFYPNTSVFDATLNRQICSIFPNPTYETLNIQLPNTIATKQIQIVNVMGIAIKDLDITGSTHINVKELPSGIYFIKVKDQPQFSFKFIKQ